LDSEITDDEVSVDREFYFQWHVTEHCNRRCLHCYHERYDSQDELSDDALLGVARLLTDALEVWDRSGAISLTGGEPWLRRSAVLAVIDELTHSGRVHRIDLLTNGVLVDDASCADLVERPLVRRVQLSLEGSTPEIHDAVRGAGSFQETEAAVRRLKRHGLTVAVMMTVSRHNAADVTATIERAAEWGADVFTVDRFIPEGQSRGLQGWLMSPSEVRQTFERVHSWTRAHAGPRAQSGPRVLMYRPLFCLVEPDTHDVGAMCSVGVNALTLMHDGTVYPCRRLPLPLGNVLRDSLHEIWYASPVLWAARSPSRLKGRCSSCQYVPVCRGCRAMALAVRGDWLEEDPQCWIETDAVRVCAPT
jgi:radical SAM protein with 4Fe4S-binding SPASM domain